MVLKFLLKFFFLKKCKIIAFYMNFRHNFNKILKTRIPEGFYPNPTKTRRLKPGPTRTWLLLPDYITTSSPLFSGRPNRTGLTGLTEPVRYPVRFGPVRYFPQIPNRTFLMKCVPKWYLRLDFTFKSSKVAIFLAKFQRFLFKVT